MRIPLPPQPANKPISSLAQGLHRKLLAAKAAAAEATQSGRQIYRGWWHDVPNANPKGQYNGWWHDVPNANPKGQYNGWWHDVVPSWLG
jgi:hypothetical protein